MDLDASYQSQRSAQVGNVPTPQSETQVNHSVVIPRNFLGSIFSSRKKQQQPSAQKKSAEVVLMNQAKDLKQNVESLYKNYIAALVSEQKNEMLQIERRINECLKKTQDLQDNIEDFTAL